MEPTREKTVNGHRVSEYQYKKEITVYVDFSHTDETFEEAVKRLVKK